MIEQEFFAEDATLVAKKLLGKVICFNGCKGKIVETEAYTDDPASHGRVITPRSNLMLTSYGYIYVYLIYGMYYCLNFTTNKGSVGAVLIRALEPLEGISDMQERRGSDDLYKLCSGPGKLCQALGITKEQNGMRLGRKFSIEEGDEVLEEDIVSSARIGIKNGTDLPWRFYLKDNLFISR